MGHKHLILDKREILQRLLEQGHGVRSCARILGYSPATISRERVRGIRKLNGKGKYDCKQAQSRVQLHRKRASRKGRHFDPAVLDYVRQGLR